ncbi:hypothetical protein HRI_004709200 [Hibiscus trionum]|uniref:Retrotransposon gag domain-containing protein n=1 Tax=Hibiscus trionum TaxID=183268 RepID=A0A9W7J9C0_HIBTR|nr:hypothetical protein HRI_004709200 [Hibiscus trionum]
MSWLINSMAPEVVSQFQLFETTSEIWEAVRDTYSSTNNNYELFGIESTSSALKQDAMNVTQYYTTLTNLWQQIDLFEAHDWVDFTDVTLYRKIVEQKRNFQFLSGINRDMDPIKSRILGLNPLPSLHEVFSKVRREESRRLYMIPKAPIPDKSTLVTQTSSSPKPRRGRTFCDYCKKPGHLKDNCWKLHGKPTD